MKHEGKVRALSLLLTLVMVINILPSMIFASSDDTNSITSQVSATIGTEANPFLISTAEALFEMAELVNTGASYGTDLYYYSACYKLTNDIDLENEEWTPIGANDYGFEGVFDGDGYEVSGVYISEYYYYTGFFGVTDYAFEIKNLGVSATITSEGTSEQYVGIIAGINGAGAIENCYSMGTFNMTEYESVTLIYFGGIAGSSVGTTSKCISLVDTENIECYTGAIVGMDTTNDNSNCYSISDDNFCNKLTYENGAFTGFSSWSDISDIWTGSMSQSPSGSTLPSYITGETDPNYDSIIVQSSYTAGTEEDPFVISTAEQMFELAELVNSDNLGTNEQAFGSCYYILSNDIYLGDEEWTPIGTGLYCFSGTFDGNGYEVSGVYISENPLGIAGLFGNIGFYYYEYGTVKNLGVSATIESDCEYSSCAGIIAGRNYGTIDNCYGMGTYTFDTSTVLDEQYFGGIAGYNEGTITNCFSLADIDVDSVESEGIYGMGSGKVSDCYVLNEVLIYDKNFGAFIGLDSWNVNSDIWTGSMSQSPSGSALPSYITGIDLWYGEGTADFPYLIYTQADLELIEAKRSSYDNFSGVYFELQNDIELTGEWVVIDWFSGYFDGNGYEISNMIVEKSGNAAFIGYLTGLGTVTNLTVDGTVTCTSNNAAGIVGTNYGTVSYCINKATIYQSASTAGGIVGYNPGGVIIGCVNYGDVISQSYQVGGIVGNTYSTITDCYNVGSVTGSSDVGGIVGNVAGSIYNCYNAGDITATSSATGYAGGIAGDVENSQTIANCFSVGTISGMNAGRIIGGGNNAILKDNYAWAYTENSVYESVGTTTFNGGDLYFNSDIGLFYIVEDEGVYSVVDYDFESMGFDTEWTKYTNAYQLPTITDVDDAEIQLPLSYTDAIKVSFVDNDGDDKTSIDAQYIEPGQSATKPTDPTLSGYVLSAWYNGTTKYTFTEIATYGDSDFTLSATYGLAAPTVKVTDDSATETVDDGKVVLTASASHALEGVTYTYAWYKGDSDTAIENETSSTLTVSGVQTDVTYKVVVTATYDTLKSTAEASATVTISSSIITDTTESKQTGTLNTMYGAKPTLGTITTVGSAETTIKYSLTGEDYTLISMPAFTTVGTHYVYYQITADGHVTLTGTIEFEIDYAEVEEGSYTYTVNDAGWMNDATITAASGYHVSYYDSSAFGSYIELSTSPELPVTKTFYVLNDDTGDVAKVEFTYYLDTDEPTISVISGALTEYHTGSETITFSIGEMTSKVESVVILVGEGDDKETFLADASTGSFTVTENGTYTIVATDSAGNVTEKEVVVAYIDDDSPTVSLKVGTTLWEKFLNVITFGLFSTDEETITIDGDDDTSDVTLYYYIDESPTSILDLDGFTGWVEYNDNSKPSISSYGTYVVYAMAEDEAGNQTIVNSDGIVYYQNSSAAATATFTKNSDTDLSIEWTINGNTIDSITVDDKDFTDYSVENNKIIFDADEIQKLSAGNHTIVITYAPQGESVGSDAYGDEPTTSTVTLTVVLDTATDDDFEVTVPDDLAYTGYEIKVEVDALIDVEDFEIVYYDALNAKLDDAPVDAGTYTYYVYMPDDDDYDDTEIYLGEFEITQREITVIPTEDTAYFGEDIEIEFTTDCDIDIPDDEEIFDGVMSISGTAIGKYEIEQNTLELVDNGDVAFDADNYKLVFTEDKIFEILEYTTTDTATAKDANENGWYCEEELTLTAPAGYQISTTGTLESVFTDTITVDLSETDEGEITYYLIYLDTGAITSAMTFEYKNDVTAPEITGAENLKYYGVDLSITATDTNLYTVTLNDNAVDEAFDIIVTENKTFTVTATDLAGNTTSIIFTTYVDDVPVLDELENLPDFETLTPEEKEEAKEKFNNLVEEYLENYDPEDEDQQDVITALEEAILEIYSNITVVGMDIVIADGIDEDKQAAIGTVVPQGLVLAIFSSLNIEDEVEIYLSITQTGGDENGLTFEIKPMIIVNGEEAEIIDNEDMLSAVSFKIYLNHSFKGTISSLTHVKSDDTTDVYENLPVYTDEIGNYIVATVFEFSEFIVSEYTYQVSVDGEVTEYKYGDTVTLTDPEKDGYTFAGWVSADVVIADNSFTVPESDVTITSSWEEIVEEDTPDTGDNSNIMFAFIALVVSGIFCLGFKKKKA